MNALIISYNISEMSYSRRSAPRIPVRKGDAMSVHEWPGISRSEHDVLGDNQIAQRNVKPSFCGPEADFKTLAIKEHHHGCYHCHVHHDLDAVGRGGEEMGEIEVLFYELEEYFNHPPLAVGLQHVNGGKPPYVCQKVDYPWFIFFRIGLLIEYLRLDMPIDGRFRNRGGTPEDPHFVKLNDPYKPAVLRGILAHGAIKDPHLFSPSFICNPHKETDLFVLFPLCLTAHLRKRTGFCKSTVDDIEIPVQPVLFRSLTDDLWKGVVLRLVGPVIIERDTEDRETVKDIRYLYVLALLAVLRLVPDMETFLKLVASLGDDSGIHCCQMKLEQMDRIIYICDISPYLIIYTLEKIDLDALETLAYARVIPHGTGGFSKRNKLLPATENLMGGTLAHLAFCYQHVEKHVEDDTTLEQLHVAVDIGLNRKLLYNFRGDYVQYVAHVLEWLLYARTLYYFAIHNLFLLWYKQIREKAIHGYLNFFYNSGEYFTTNDSEQ